MTENESTTAGCEHYRWVEFSRESDWWKCADCGALRTMAPGTFKLLLKEQESCESCGTCRFSTKGVELWGYCRRWPPVTAHTGISLFPWVSLHEWCGEYEPRSNVTDNRDAWEKGPG